MLCYFHTDLKKKLINYNHCIIYKNSKYMRNKRTFESISNSCKLLVFGWYDSKYLCQVLVLELQVLPLPPKPLPPKPDHNIIDKADHNIICGSMENTIPSSSRPFTDNLELWTNFSLNHKQMLIIPITRQYKNKRIDLILSNNNLSSLSSSSTCIPLSPNLQFKTNFNISQHKVKTHKTYPNQNYNININ